MIIKALVIPIFTFVACVVPDKYRKEIESKCFKFLWNGRPDKVKRNTDSNRKKIVMVDNQSFLCLFQSSTTQTEDNYNHMDQSLLRLHGHPETWKTILSLSTVCILTFGQTREVDKETVIVFYAL
jgi:murein L,D-transpeptidase YcbB/YkuD